MRRKLLRRDRWNRARATRPFTREIDWDELDVDAFGGGAAGTDEKSATEQSAAPARARR